MAYPPAGSIVTRIEVQRERRFAGYNVRSIPLVYAGQEVLADQPVIRLELNQVAGQSQPDAPIVIPSGLRGKVVKTTARGGVVIQTRAALLTGNIGAGQQVAGFLTIWQSTSSRLSPIPAGAILVIPSPATFAMLRQAVASGVVGVVASSIEMRDLEGFLGLDVFDLLNSVDVDMLQASLPSLTLLFTEGFGSLPMPPHTFQLLTRYQGAIALLSGVTSTRNARYPELLISLPEAETRDNWQPHSFDASLRLGARVRVRFGTNAGATGDIDYFFVHQHRFVSGVQGRAVRLRMEDGTTLVAPIMNIERIP
ncbi:MAG TPA: hypothetical protein VJO32_09500 [Ktedonobacteraceae bacterium]|nr:hypothetical protein [Ktedonobacteraceae bacterium]